MLKRIDDLLESRIEFAFETTLATRTYKSKILKAQANGYKVILLFFWLQVVELAIERIEIRVKEGGHNIDRETVVRRYLKGIKNLFEIYLPIADEVFIFDNSNFDYKLIAEKNYITGNFVIHKEEEYNILTQKIND